MQAHRPDKNFVYIGSAQRMTANDSHYPIARICVSPKTHNRRILHPRSHRVEHEEAQIVGRQRALATNVFVVAAKDNSAEWYRNTQTA